MSRPLHEQQPTTRFSDRVAEYVKYRPSYPREAIEAVLDGLSPVPTSRGVGFQPVSRGTGFQPVRGCGVLRAADIGAGTGISARVLAECGVHVIAIEPNEAMRSAGVVASESLQGGGLSSPRSKGDTRGLESPSPCDMTDLIEWRAGTAEATGLDEASVDLVLCAQSYHWFEPIAACREFGRILRPGGRLALMWNDADETDPVAKGYYDLVRAASEGVGPTSHQRVAQAPCVGLPFEQSAMRRLHFRHEHRLDVDGFVGRAMSASYVPKEGAKAEWLVARLRELHAVHVGEDGCVGMVYGVWVYVCEVERGCG